MKKMLMTSIMMMVLSISTMLGMTTSSIRTNARFLSDRMAYELDLTPMQYDDVYEINFDYIYAINRIMDDVVRGYHYAIDEYYELLDERNEDLSYVLTARQYRQFIQCEYFYRPVYSTGRTWAFRIHTIYSNVSFYYYDAPRCYKTYCGAHYHRTSRNYYVDRWSHQSHDRYADRYHIRGSEHHNHYSKNDFGVNRRNPKGNDKNNYGNANHKNRENDSRYEHRNGNQNSPNINHRDGNKGGNNGGNNNNNGGRGSSNSKGNDNKGNTTGSRATVTHNRR